jgi:hypothetical protein
LGIVYFWPHVYLISETTCISVKSGVGGIIFYNCS